MLPQESQRGYVSNHRGWRGGKRSLAHQAKCIIDSALDHGRDIDFYKPSEELRAVIEKKLLSQKSPEGVELYLRTKAQRQENERFAAIGSVSAA